MSSAGPAVTWRRAQVLLLPAQGVSVAKIAEVTFTSVLAVDHRHGWEAFWCVMRDQQIRSWLGEI